MDPDRYPSEIFWSEEDEGYIALARDLPGCSAFGSSKEEAIGELRAAVSAWIEAAKSAGNPIPPPSSRPEFSGKFVVRMPKTLHGELAARAAEEGVSLNQFVVYLLSEKRATYMQTAPFSFRTNHFVPLSGRVERGIFAGGVSLPATHCVTVVGSTSQGALFRQISSGGGDDVRSVESGLEAPFQDRDICHG